MLNRVFGKNTHDYLHILGLSGIAFSLTFSKVVMSISMMFIVLNVLLEADFKTYWQKLKSNRIYHLALLFCAVHVIGLLWSKDIGYGLHDLRAKLPLLVIATILTAKPVTNRLYLHIVLGLFLISLAWTSFCNIGFYQHWFGSRVYDNFRGMSLFGSHIRYGMLIAFGVAVCLYFAKTIRKWAIPFLLFAAWLSYYTIYSQVITGVLALSAVLIVFILYHIRNRSSIAAYIFLGSIVIGAGLGAIWLFNPLTIDPADYQNLPEYTAKGNRYVHNLDYVSSETGEPILIYVCEPELKDSWNKRSSIGYDSLDMGGHQVKNTLIRFLSSKRLHKDAAGMEQLSNEDIICIERGFPSEQHSGLMARLHGLRFEINNTDDPNGRSLLQRIEYWKTGWAIAKDHWLIGVGTGDAQVAFDQKYEETNSVLLPENRHRSHNMYITIFLSFGIIGLGIFLFMLFYFVRINLKQLRVLPLMFIAVFLITFLIEDSLETQTGITFFALFYGLYSLSSNKLGKQAKIVPIHNKISKAGNQ